MSRPLQRGISGFGENKKNNNDIKDTTFGQSLTPDYDPYEFLPYKLKREKNLYFMGFGPGEAMAIKFGHKNSKVVRREMALDTVIFCVMSVIIMVIFYLRKKSIDDYHEAFHEYMDGQLSYQRKAPQVNN